MPLISVIVPVYNVAQYLKRCVDSLIEQTTKDIEIILVDDGSTDESGSLCDLYKDKDNRLKVIHKANGGLTSARLAGFNLAEGDLVAFVDSDDYVRSDMYEKMADAILEERADICHCSYYFVNKEAITEKSLAIKSGAYDRNGIREQILTKMAGRASWENEDYVKGFMPLKLYRRSLIETSWFVSERDYFAEDIVFNLNAFAKAERVIVIDTPLYYYVYNEKSLSNRYREGLWDMYHRLHLYVYKFYAEYNMYDTVRIRLNNALVGMALGAINNAGKSSNKKSILKKVEEVRNILKTPELKRSLKEQAQDRNLLRRLYYTLISMDFSWPLLIIANLRMRRYG